MDNPTTPLEALQNTVKEPLKPTAIDALKGMDRVETTGDIRRIVSTSLLALARGETSTATVEALARGLDSISGSLNAEIRVAKAKVELRDKGSTLGHLDQLGKLPLGTQPNEA